MIVAHLTYSIGIHKHRNQSRGKVDKTILQCLLESDLGLDDIARRLLGRHGGEMKRKRLPQRHSNALSMLGAPSPKPRSSAAMELAGGGRKGAEQEPIMRGAPQRAQTRCNATSPIPPKLRLRSPRRVHHTQQHLLEHSIHPLSQGGLQDTMSAQRIGLPTVAAPVNYDEQEGVYTSIYLAATSKLTAHSCPGRLLQTLQVLLH